MDYDPMSPIWLQVVNRIKGAVVTGAIGPGDKLPGGRDLAVQYSINPNTAARVYQELEREGLCETRRGMGTYVTENTETISALRAQMASEAADRFLRDLRMLGLDSDDAIFTKKHVAVASAILVFADVNLAGKVERGTRVHVHAAAAIVGRCIPADRAAIHGERSKHVHAAALLRRRIFGNAAAGHGKGVAVIDFYTAA